MHEARNKILTLSIIIELWKIKKYRSKIDGKNVCYIFDIENDRNQSFFEDIIIIVTE